MTESITIHSPHSGRRRRTARCARSLQEILEQEGFQVSQADSGEAALDILRQTPIDLMLLDLKMKGMDGLQTTEAAKRLSPETVIIMLTAHGTLESAIGADAARRV